jgi:hypothetical protein
MTNKTLKSAPKKEVVKGTRVLRELTETAADLAAYGLVSKTDMARMNALCEEPPPFLPKHRP